MAQVQSDRNQLALRSTGLFSGSFPRHLIEKKLPEWLELESTLKGLQNFAVIEPIGESTLPDLPNLSLPLWSVQMGSQDPEAPVLGIFGGIHGLERIGTHVCLSLLHSLMELMLWDDLTKESLKKIRIVAIPLINPLGMMNLQRSNPNGVDLMRNSPSRANPKPPFLLGGQSYSRKLPWFKGGPQMEPESQAVLDFCRQQFFKSKTVLTLDFHSGFGWQDQLWFPYAKNKMAFPHLPELHAIKALFDNTYPNHFYKIEPQAKNYTTDGDLWDHIYDCFRKENPQGVYLPLALEMGSWIWIKKNPLQLFSPLGPFNPIKAHRKKRILRRHLTLFDFLIRSLVSPSPWAHLLLEQRNKHELRAQELWYDN